MNILNNLRTFFLTFLMVIALGGLFTACNSEQLDLGASGRNLEVHVCVTWKWFIIDHTPVPPGKCDLQAL